jgi:arginyl-tRNA synthetase
MLKSMFQHIKHVGLGLVKTKDSPKTKGGKMSSRLGNVIWMQDVIDYLGGEFAGNERLAYNVFAGLILKSAPRTDKTIDMEQISNPLNSPGLYMSYTLAKLKSAGCVIKNTDKFHSQALQFKYMKAQSTLSPNVLFDGVVNHAKAISSLYVDHKIKDDEENQKMFELLGSDLLLGMQKLGLFDIDKV